LPNFSTSSFVTGLSTTIVSFLGAAASVGFAAGRAGLAAGRAGFCVALYASSHAASRFSFKLSI